MASFGFVFIPLMAKFVYDIFGAYSHKWRQYAGRILLIVALVMIGRGVIYSKSVFSPVEHLASFVFMNGGRQEDVNLLYILRYPEIATGLVPGINGAAEFFNRNQIQGPLFNNYDNGGYLIFHLFPRVKVFVDNRPEVYSVSFFKDMYVPMQENNDVWKTMDEKYQFNSIFFYRHDLTPWGQNLMINRIQDPNWAPVYVDLFSIIFLKRNERNRALIDAYELPKSMFSFTQ